MATIGRTPIDLDEETVKELCHAQLTNVEIARICKCSEDTLERRFAGKLKEWKHEGVGSMRRELWRVGIGSSKGKVPAMIFFLKNYGGMKDNVNVSGQINVNHEDGNALDSMLSGVEDQNSESVQ